MLNNSKQHWYQFYGELLKLYNLMLSDTDGCARVLYQSQDHHLATDENINKRYRAVVVVSDPGDLEQVRASIERAEQLFYQAVAADNKGKGKKTPRRPVYIPRLLDNEADLLKIQVHENKAHSSDNYTTADMVIVASCPRKSLSLPFDNERTNRQVLQHAAEVLEADGYQVEIEDTPKNPYFILSIDAKTMCHKHQCNSIQRRFFTGKQIRANFFTIKDNVMQKSKLATLGFIVLSSEVAVIQSLERSIRTDAKYVKAHADEIVLEAIPKDMRSGRLYKRYRK